MTDYGKIKTVRELAETLGLKLQHVIFNSRMDGDVEFVYSDNARRHYKNVESGFDGEIERLRRFIHAAETM